jgi:putative transposase
MTALLIAVLTSLRALSRSRLNLAAEILALRHQLALLQRATPKRPRIRPLDRLLRVLLSSVWPNWRQALQIVTPATVLRWHRRSRPIGAGTRNGGASGDRPWHLTSAR